MNGVLLGTKQVVVRLHEPKQLRQEKLAQRFGGHNGHPRNSSGATSPTASEGGESIAGWSPRHHASALGSPVQTHYERPERGRRGSGSYYNVFPRYFSFWRVADSFNRLLCLAPSTSPCVTMIFTRCRLSCVKRCSLASSAAASNPWPSCPATKSIRSSNPSSQSPSPTSYNVSRTPPSSPSR